MIYNYCTICEQRQPCWNFVGYPICHGCGARVVNRLIIPIRDAYRDEQHRKRMQESMRQMDVAGNRSSGE